MIDGFCTSSRTRNGTTREEASMNGMLQKPAEREVQRVQTNREELIERIERAMHADGVAQPLPGLHLARSSSPLGPVHGVFEPFLCVIAQGSKEILLGESRYCYDPFHYLVTPLDLPYTGQVLEASKARPYLSLRLSLAPTLVSSVMVEAGHAQPRDQANVRAISVSPLDGNLLDAVVRLTRLLDAPDDVPILRPLLTQEIIYRLLMGEQGTRLRHLYASSENLRSESLPLAAWHQPSEVSCRGDSADLVCKHLGVSISKREKCTLSRTGYATDFWRWSSRRIKVQGLAVRKSFPFVK